MRYIMASVQKLVLLVLAIAYFAYTEATPNIFNFADDVRQMLETQILFKKFKFLL